MTEAATVQPGTDEEMSLVQLFADKFIAKLDVKAIQFPNGAYIPDYKLKYPGAHAPMGFAGRHLLAHLRGERTYGHYLLDANNNCKLFAFDIDLQETGSWWEFPDLDTLPDDISDDEFDKLTIEHPCNPRELWQDRSAFGARRWFKYQMHSIAHKFAACINGELGLPTVAAYTGAKGVHVYALTGLIPAAEAREGALMVLDMLGEFEVLRGQNFFKHKYPGMMGFQNFSIETFPKQAEVHNENGLGNLLRLPLGRNVKSEDPTFFIDMTQPLGMLNPHQDPVKLLTNGEPFGGI